MIGYSDPLHVSWEELTVYYEGQAVIILNKRLLDQQNCWTNLEDIKEVHWLKYVFFDMILNTDDPALLKSLAQDLTLCEFELQRLWGFSQDEKFHRFWLTPKCECPKMDNEDAYPTGYYVINLSCPLHGNLTVEERIERLEAEVKRRRL